jgi:hypothetical protein
MSLSMSGVWLLVQPSTGSTVQMTEHLCTLYFLLDVLSALVLLIYFWYILDPQIDESQMYTIISLCSETLETIWSIFAQDIPKVSNVETYFTLLNLKGSVSLVFNPHHEFFTFSVRESFHHVVMVIRTVAIVPTVNHCGLCILILSESQGWAFFWLREHFCTLSLSSPPYHSTHSLSTLCPLSISADAPPQSPTGKKAGCGHPNCRCPCSNCNPGANISTPTMDFKERPFEIYQRSKKKWKYGS